MSDTDDPRRRRGHHPRDWPTALASALLLIAGSARAIVADLDHLAAALLAAGLIVLGVWIRDGED